MDDLLCFLHSIENIFARTIFNFHLTNTQLLNDIYGYMQRRITSTNSFSSVVADMPEKNLIKKIVYCDIQLTKHLLNHEAYPNYEQQPVSKRTGKYFDVSSEQDDHSLITASIFERDRSSLVSYIKTTNKKQKINYGEIKKTITNSSGNSLGYFSGRKGDDYLSTEIKANAEKPWIKSILKHMKIEINYDSIITKGKSSILQTIEIIFTHRTCVKIFKDSTIHIILSKDKNECGCVGMIDKLFSTYKILFMLFNAASDNPMFMNWVKVANDIVTATNFNDKIKIITENKDMYGIGNFRIGMFNLTYKPKITHTVFPSMLSSNNKIKFFKGKKLNLVALRSLEDCMENVSHAQLVLSEMKSKAERLSSINVDTELVEILKDLLI
ncbi:large subunit viral intermediate transcription factor [Pteropox virus]|uniref:Intermediate transcription factor 3 large subunit n=1 Tax=Pteropox virus TaxID=1873698 RepID=A0A1B1MRL6_9POXV|nr:large subunit viral intermediate transcription factor [Pteropox virus]ANS71202.1 large subunit viral intermediate transcription factor [Pteropox virus]